MTIIEKIRTHNAERYELAEALAQTYEDIDTYEHLLPALQADSQKLSELKQRYWYTPLGQQLPNNARIAQATALEVAINQQLQVLGQCQTGTRIWLANSQQLLTVLAQLQSRDISLSHLASKQYELSQLEALGTQFHHAYQHVFTTAHVA